MVTVETTVVVVLVTVVLVVEVVVVVVWYRLQQARRLVGVRCPVRRSLITATVTATATQ